MRFCWAFLLFLWCSGSFSALAQDTTDVPDLEQTFSEPADALSDPSGPAQRPPGYGEAPVLPEPLPPTALSPEAASDGAVRIHALPWGTRRLTLHARELHAPEQSSVSCAAPCTLDLSPGRYTFSVQPQGGGPRRADEQPIWVSGSQLAVQMSYDHRAGLRSVGWVFFSLAATALSLSSIGGPLIMSIVGAPLAAAFLIPFFPLVFLNDSARVQVVPLPR